MNKTKLGIVTTLNKYQIKNTIKENPHYVEIIITAQDILYNSEYLYKTLTKLISIFGNKNIYIRQPIYTEYNELIQLDVSVNDPKYNDVFFILEKMILISKEFDINLIIKPINFIYDDNDIYFDDALVHPEYKINIQELIFARMEYIKKIGGDNVIFENSISKVFDFTNDKIINYLLKNEYNISFDIHNAFISTEGNNYKLQESIIRLRDITKHYHFSDSKGIKTEYMDIGTGYIDWKNIFKHINDKASTTLIIKEPPDSVTKKETIKNYNVLLSY